MESKSVFRDVFIKMVDVHDAMIDVGVDNVGRLWIDFCEVTYRSLCMWSWNFVKIWRSFTGVNMEFNKNMINNVHRLMDFYKKND